MSLYFRNATLLHGGTDWTARTGANLLIEAGRIAAIGAQPPPQGAEVIDATNLLLLPAFANAHTHSPEMLRRGVLPMADQVEWLTDAYGGGLDALSDADITSAIRLCAYECVRGGAVAVTDHIRQAPPRAEALIAAAQAWAGTGLRAKIAMNARDRVAGGVPVLPTDTVLGILETLLRAGLPVRFGAGPSAPQRVTDEFLQRATALSRAHGGFLHMHLCESAQDAATCLALYGESAVAHLHRLGVLGPDWELPHSVHVSDADLALIAASGARIVHNPVANLRLGAGIAPIARALAAGIDVRLGTDGAGSNDAQSMLEAAKFALLLPRAARPAAEWPTPAQVLRMATGGAVLAPGAEADLIAFDLTASAFLGDGGDLPARILLAAREADLAHVLCAGRFLMRDRHVTLA